MAHLKSGQRQLIARVRRIAGQLASVERALQEEVDCAAVLQQVAAIRGAVNGLVDEVIEAHLREHVAAPGLEPAERERGAEELIAAIRRYANRQSMTFDDELDELTHDHVFLGEAHDANARRTLLVVALTAVMMVGEIVAGTLFNSMALLADGFHMATHAGALAVAAGAYAFARRHVRSGRYTFGTGKVGDLAGFASALVLAVVAIGIAWEAIGRLLAPEPVAFGQATVVAVLGLAVNLVSALLLSGQHHHGHGHDAPHHDAHGHRHGHHHDNNLRAAFVHVLADALTSVLAIVALLAGRYLGWVWLDPVMGIVGAIVIAIWSAGLLRDTASVLLDATDQPLEDEVREEVEGPGGARITDLHVWRLGPGTYGAIVSYVGAASPADVRTRLKRVHELGHVTVEAFPAPAKQ